MRLVDSRIIVTRVTENGPADWAGVKPGWIVQAVGDTVVADLLAKIPADVSERRRTAHGAVMVMNRLRGAPESVVEVEFRDGTEQTVRAALKRWREPGETFKFGNLPPLVPHLTTERLTTAGGSTIGVIRFNMWMPPIARSFDEAIDAFREVDGIVIDVRGNGGGAGMLMMGMAGHFIDERASLGTVTMRDMELRFVVNPRRVDTQGRRVTPYAGPLAILIDGLSVSASEAFAGGMQAVGRARVFGETSYGAVLGSVIDRLPNGDALQHATSDFVTAAGERLEGRGAIPDEVVPLTREDLLAGRDGPLVAALRWIDEQHRRSTQNDHATHARFGVPTPPGRASTIAYTARSTGRQR